jgi:hypothetical protein
VLLQAASALGSLHLWTGARLVARRHDGCYVPLAPAAGGRALHRTHVQECLYLRREWVRVLLLLEFMLVEGNRDRCGLRALRLEERIRFVYAIPEFLRLVLLH